MFDFNRYIFTNADRVHANVCLEHIGIKECFEDIISFDCIVDWAKGQGGDVSKKVFCKPERESFEVRGGQPAAAVPSSPLPHPSVPFCFR